VTVVKIIARVPSRVQRLFLSLLLVDSFLFRESREESPLEETLFPLIVFVVTKTIVVTIVPDRRIFARSTDAQQDRA